MRSGPSNTVKRGVVMLRGWRSTMRVPVAAILVMAVGGVLLVAGPLMERAHANGVPTLVTLSYIDLSNWGPEEATGTAELLFAEGLVNVTIDGLPELTDERYQGWLVNSQVGDAITVGRFNADASGAVNYQGALPPIADFGFDLFIVTVEPEPDDAPQPSETRSVGGYFTLVGEPGTDVNGTDNSGSTTAPEQLPATGDFTLQSDLVRMGLLLAVMGLSVFVGLRLGRRSA